MAESKKQRRWICTFELSNKQESYAKCLQMVSWLETITKQEPNKELCDVPNPFVNFYISRAKTQSIQNPNILLEQEELLVKGEKSKLQEITSADILLAGLNKEKGEHIFNYYFRVYMSKDESDIIELQYAVLLLQAFPAIRNRVAVRLMNEPGEAWQKKDFFHVSHFLQFIQKQYCCFYACYDENVRSLRQLLPFVEGTQSTFLPLLEVNSIVCQPLNKVWFLNAKYGKQKYEKLYSAIFPRNCKSSDITWNLFQIGLKMLFKNWDGRAYQTEIKKRMLLDFLCKVVQDMQGITPLDMLLFGALGGNAIKNDFNLDVAKECMGRIQMLSQAISQILENIVNHSERAQGVFTFRIQRNIEYLKLNYPEFVCSKKRNCLELLIADSNRSDGIVKHFLNSNKADVSVKEISNTICLGNLFGDYQNREIESIWQEARKKRPEMCHGLISFARNVRSLNGAARVRSAPDYKETGNRYLYYFNGTEKVYDSAVFSAHTFIPGTQFSVVMNPIEANGVTMPNNNLGWAFDFDKLVYATTYRELAQSISFDSKVRSIAISEPLLDSFPCSKGQFTKDKLATKWKEWFNSLVPENESHSRIVYECDLEELCSYIQRYPEAGEPLCKGFLSSRFFIEPNTQVYYAIILQNLTAQFSRIFAGTLNVMAIQEAFSTENTCVYFYPKRYQNDYLPYCAASLSDLLPKASNEDIFPRVFPYSLFLSNEKGETLFEEELLKQADTSILDEKNQGFKISNTHMRLGNKVHIDTFYEMALFFENPNYAYYSAFLFLRTFLQYNGSLLIKQKKLIFYGYASYSRAIVWAILQILKQYRELQKLEAFPEMEFIIYQNDLKLESEQPQIQMYYSNKNWQKNPQNIWNPDEVSVIMIVPISTSLTTFKKMEMELQQETRKKFKVIENYTAFWVRNEYKHVTLPTKEEKSFWEKVDPVGKTIESSQIQGKVRYLVSVTSKWSNPLDCHKCFPKDPILEYPLVETDPTSTVPTQQFYCYHTLEKPAIILDKKQAEENDQRIRRLQSNIIYGHVSKGSNHYQYYVKTREYFQQERNQVASWLNNLYKEAKENNNPAIVSPSCINVLIIPQQSSNVEFGQYIYEYYFRGHAECIVVNIEKEFRSNLKAEYSGLFSRLKAVKNPVENIKFHYVDTSVHTGSSFSRIVSLISSCLGVFGEDKQAEDKFQAYEFHFDQAFFLVSQLSEDSKWMYVKNPKKNFHAYAEMHISAMRNFGDSCVPCKLQMEAQRYYKCAATKSFSAYWEEKIHDRACISFDELKESKQLKAEIQEEGYRRMICTHRAAYHIRPVQGAELSNYFQAVRNFLDEICYANNLKEYEIPIYHDIDDGNRKEWLAAALKIIARPFFSFDYKIRCVVMDIYLLISECFIKRCSADDLRKRLQQADEQEVGDKKYLLNEGILDWIGIFTDTLIKYIGDNEYYQLEFFRNNILKSLADIKSNYIMRKDTMLSLAERLAGCGSGDELQKNVEVFLEHYLRSILRLTHSSSDETKSIWLEHLLQYGKEYESEIECKNEGNGIEQLVKLMPEGVQSIFHEFVEVLLVENNRPLYQAVIEFDKYEKQNEEKDKRQGWNQSKDVLELLDSYRMRNAGVFLSFQQSEKQDANQIAKGLKSLRKLLLQLEKTGDNGNYTRYQTLGEIIQKVVASETAMTDKVVLFGRNSEDKSPIAEYLELPNYFTMYPEDFENDIGREKSPERRFFEEYWQQIQNSPVAKSTLERNSFYLLESNNKSKHFNIFIMLDNNYVELKEKFKQGITYQKIEPIYMFIPCAMQRQKALGLIRKILMFRQRLIEWLEMDFNNEAIAVLSQQKHLAKLLSMDKIGDHAENDFVESQQKVSMATTEEEFKWEKDMGNWEYAVSEIGKEEGLYELSPYATSPISGYLVKAREWFLLRSYVNSRISRLFRTMVRGENVLADNSVIDVDTYYAREGQSVMMRPARNLKVVFFTPITVGYIRKTYLKSMLETITFTVNGEPDYKENREASIDERLVNLKESLSEFTCISFKQPGTRREYAYLAEYLATILLDCFVSALKAGEVWNQSQWSGEAFERLSKKNAPEKCQIDIFREKGETYNEKAFDYLVIHNKIYHILLSDKKGPGMSQAAIRWYVEGLWRYVLQDNKDYPKVIVSSLKEKRDEYTIKLPILERRKCSEHE